MIHLLAVVAVLAGAVAAAGCGLGAGDASPGEAALTVTRDYGAEEVLDAAVDDPTESDTVIRVLDREAEIATRHGGGFVQSIEGIAGGAEGARSRDWFFYVNGIESPVGAAEVVVEPGDRIWWDHHDWTDVMRVPAVVGSFPQPFAAASGDGAGPIEVGCATRRPVCESAAQALARAGVEAEAIALGAARRDPRPRLLVGPFRRLAGDRVAGLLRDGPERSGVFARFGRDGEELELLDERARAEHGGELGLVAATARGEEPPTWLVTGTDDDAVARAAELLGAAALRNRFAVAVAGDGEPIPLPVGR